MPGLQVTGSEEMRALSSEAGSATSTGPRLQHSGLRRAADVVVPPMVLGLLPLGLLALAAFTYVSGHDLGVDFHGELYPEAMRVREGMDPFTAANANLAGGVNRIFPVAAALLVVPLTVLPAGAATDVFVGLLLASLVASVWVLGVRDWRVYGPVLLWPASISALQTGNLTILLGLLVGVAWRWRERRYVPGLAVGAAIALKIFLWPLLVWLIATRRYRASAAAITFVAASVVLVLPFASLVSYLRLLDNLGRTFARESYTIEGLLLQARLAGLASSRLITLAIGMVVLAYAFRRRSLPMTVAAALALSPIVWLHYFELFLPMVALRCPRLSSLWFVPFALWLCPGNVAAVREHDIALALVVLALVSALAERTPRPRALGRPP